jgi:hypothetical protein
MPCLEAKPYEKEDVMTEHEQNDEQGGVRERLGDVVHAVQEAVADRVAPVTDRVAPAVDAVTSALHEAGQVAQSAAHLGRRETSAEPEPEPETGPEPVPSGTQIVRPAKHGSTFLAWRNGQWTPVYREHGVGWFWGA